MDVLILAPFKHIHLLDVHAGVQSEQVSSLCVDQAWLDEEVLISVGLHESAITHVFVEGRVGSHACSHIISVAD